MNIHTKLNELNNLYEEQLILLENMNNGIDMIKIGPFCSAKVYLEEATKEHRGLEDRMNHIVKAKDNFIQALGIFYSKQSKIYGDYYLLCNIHLYIAICWDLLGSKNDSLDWLKSSLNECLKARDSICEIQGDLVIRREKIEIERDKILDYTNSKANQTMKILLYLSNQHKRVALTNLNNRIEIFNNEITALNDPYKHILKTVVTIESVLKAGTRDTHNSETFLK